MHLLCKQLQISEDNLEYSITGDCVFYVKCSSSGLRVSVKHYLDGCAAGKS